MSKSRLEAVATALAEAHDGSRLDAMASWRSTLWYEQAQAAIDANDAWLKARVDIAADRIKDRWMHVQPRETLSWQQVAETTVEALLYEPSAKEPNQ